MPSACQSTAIEIATKYKSVKAHRGKLPWEQFEYDLDGPRSSSWLTG